MSFLLLAVACVSSGASVARQLEPPSVLVVQNDRTDDSWVYLQRGGVKTRKLGLAHALRTDTLLLPASEISPGASLRFVAIAFASGAVDRSDDITAQRGVAYMWQIGPARGANFLWQRSADGEISTDSSQVCRAPGCRSSGVARRFMRLTGHAKGWPGHVVDHMHPLECGGIDAVSNLMWQTIAEATAKDRLEAQCGRWLPSLRSDGKPAPNAPIP